MNVPIGITIGILLMASATAAERIDETRPIHSDGVVEISNVRGSIRVEGGARSDVGISALLGGGVEGLKVEGDARRLSIKVQYPNSDGGWFSGWSSGGKAGDSALTVTVPAGVTLVVIGVSADIDVSGLAGARVDVSTVSGDVAYAGSAEELHIESVSGDVEITGSAAEVSLHSVSGDMTMNAAVGQRLRLETVSGDARLTGTVPLHTLDADAVSGDLDLSLAPAAGARFKAGTLSGDIALSLGQGASARLRVETFSGSIRSDFGKLEKDEYGPGSRLDTQIGGGDADVRIETFSGAVVVRTP